MSPPAIYNVTVTCGNLTVLPSTLPNVLQGTSYSSTLSVPNGLPPYIFKVTSGALPANMNLVNATIAGYPHLLSRAPMTSQSPRRTAMVASAFKRDQIVVTPTTPGITFNPLF